MLERATITRLGEGVDNTRRLAPAAVERNLACLRAYAEDLRAPRLAQARRGGHQRATRRRGCAGLPGRGRAHLGRAAPRDRGRRRGTLTFRGALSGLTLRGRLPVFDVGGGSTELVVGDAAGATPPESRVSLDIGSVRLFERHVHGDPPSPAELANIEADIARQLASAAPLSPLAGAGPLTLVGVAGTVTTLKSLELGLPAYDSARVHGAILTLSAVEALCAKLASLSLAERQRLPGLHPKRADVIVVGSLIVRDLLRRAGATETVVSDRGVRFGLLELFARA